MPTVLVSWPRSFEWKIAPNACTVPVTTCQQSPAARRTLVPSEYVLSAAAGTKPKIQRPPTFSVARGPSFTSWPPRWTVTVIGRPWLPRISSDTRSKVFAACPLTATTRSPTCSPAFAAGVLLSTSPTFVLAVFDGAPVA